MVQFFEVCRIANWYVFGILYSTESVKSNMAERSLQRSLQRSLRCDEIIRKYKTDCGDMIRVSNASYPSLVSLSHTQFLTKLLAISKQDIELSPAVFASFKTLMNHARDCSRGRLRYTAECVPRSQRDIGHEIENNRTKEIYLEMQNSFKRMKEKLKASATSCHIDGLLQEEEEEIKSNVYDWLDEGDVKEEEEAKEEEELMYDWATQRQHRQERQEQKREHRRHRENIRLLLEQVRESRDSQLSDIRTHLKNFGSFFSDSMTEKTVGKKGEEENIIQFSNLRGLYFTFDQMTNIILYSKLHADMFINFIHSTYLIRRHESLTGVGTTDCITCLERISRRKYLAEILRFSQSQETMIYILFTSPEDSFLDNLDHLARVDPYVFDMLRYVRPAPPARVLNEEKNVTTNESHLFELARQPPDRFQFILGSVSKAIAFAMEKRKSILSVDEFSKYFTISHRTALRIMASEGRRDGVSIPIDQPNQMMASIGAVKNGVWHNVLLRCTIKEDNRTFLMPEKFRSTVETAQDVYMTGFSTAFLECGKKMESREIELFQDGAPVKTVSRLHRGLIHPFDYRELTFEFYEEEYLT